MKHGRQLAACISISSYPISDTIAMLLCSFGMLQHGHDRETTPGRSQSLVTTDIRLRAGRDVGESNGFSTLPDNRVRYGQLLLSPWHKACPSGRVHFIRGRARARSRVRMWDAHVTTQSSIPRNGNSPDLVFRKAYSSSSSGELAIQTFLTRGGLHLTNGGAPGSSGRTEPCPLRPRGSGQSQSSWRSVPSGQPTVSSVHSLEVPGSWRPEPSIAWSGMQWATSNPRRHICEIPAGLEHVERPAAASKCSGLGSVMPCGEKSFSSASQGPR
jgi:hypothetical protein